MLPLKEKVLVIAPCPFFIDRGTPIRIKRLAAMLADQFEVHVACFGQGRDGSFPFTIHRTRSLPLRIQRSGANLAKLVYDFLLVFKTIRLLRREQIRLVDGHLHEGALIGLLAKIFCKTKVIYNAHGTFVPELIATGAIRQNSLLVKPLSAFELWVENNVDSIVAQSRLRHDEFISRGHSPDKVSVVEDVPELDELWLEDDQVDKCLEAKLRQDNAKLLIYSGGMETYQGVDFLLEAFQEICQRRDDVNLVLFGRPLQEYRIKAEQMGVAGRVIFVDDEPFERLPQYLKICDIGFALRLYGENVPGKLPIYMASGLPVVGTNTKGVNTVIKDNVTGILVEPDNVSTLVEKVIYLLDNPQARSSIGQEGRQEALRRYSPDIAKKDLAAIYNKLLAES